MTVTARMKVRERSEVAQARRRAIQLLDRLGFASADLDRAALLATELSTNLVRYGDGHGQLVVTAMERDHRAGFELLALDSGQGMLDADRQLRDGVSTTSGSMGIGLGTVRRLSDEFDVYSRERRGTAVLARCFPERRIPVDGYRVGAISIPIAGEKQPGDRWEWHPQESGALVMLADGLGHGPYAAEAAERAVSLLRSSSADDPVRILSRAHRELRSTRGAAVAVVRFSGEKLAFASVGNVEARLVHGTRGRPLLSQPGTVGLNARKIRLQTVPWSPGSALVLHTDGLSARWTADSYPGLFERDPSIIAGVLFQDLEQSRDDATVVVVKPEAAV